MRYTACVMAYDQYSEPNPAPCSIALILFFARSLCGRSAIPFDSELPAPVYLNVYPNSFAIVFQKSFDRASSPPSSVIMYRWDSLHCSFCRRPRKRVTGGFLLAFNMTHLNLVARSTTSRYERYPFMLVMVLPSAVLSFQSLPRTKPKSMCSPSPN